MSIPPRTLDTLTRQVVFAGILNAAQVTALHQALDQAYAQGSVDQQMDLEEAVEAQRDPMKGAIDRFRTLVTDADWGTPQDWHRAEREMGLALNEAFRNGHRSATERHSCETPARVFVAIPAIARDLQPGGDADVQAWPARLNPSMNIGPARSPLYQIEGDPNAVAVGRFKASLRKFLGVD